MKRWTRVREESAKQLLQKYPELQQDAECCAALCQVLFKVEVAPKYGSGIASESGKLIVPKDLPEWKQTRKKLKQVAKLLSEIIDIVEDDKSGKRNTWHLVEVLSYADYNDRLPDLISGLTELRDITDKIVQVKGTAGNRPLPLWMEMAVQSVAHFWRDNNIKGKKPNPYFKEGTYEAGNSFTKFCCDVLTANKEMKPEQVRTVLEHNDFKKLLNAPSYWV